MTQRGHTMGKSRKMTKRETLAMFEAERQSLADLGHVMSAWDTSPVPFADPTARCYNCSGVVRNEGVLFMESARLRGRCIWEA